MQGYTALHYALRSDALSIIDILIEYLLEQDEQTGQDALSLLQADVLIKLNNADLIKAFSY